MGDVVSRRERALGALSEALRESLDHFCDRIKYRLKENDCSIDDLKISNKAITDIVEMKGSFAIVALRASIGDAMDSTEFASIKEAVSSKK